MPINLFFFPLLIFCRQTSIFFFLGLLLICLIFKYILCPCHLQAATKILARQLVRLRQQIANLQGSRAQMRGIATHTQVDC